MSYSYSTKQYDAGGLKSKVNHHEFLEVRDGPEEYAGFDLERFKGGLMDKFVRDTEDIANENDRIKSDALTRIDEYERNNINEREFEMGEGSLSFQRKTISEKVSSTNQEFDRSTKEAASEKRRLREEMADLEDALRKVRDELAETELENQNFQTIINAFEDIQGQQRDAEMNAVRTVNTDLKDQISKLEHELNFAGGATDTLNMKFGLEEKYSSAKGDFENFISEAEEGKKRIDDELANLRHKISQKKNENNVLHKDVNDNESQINKLNDEITRLSRDIEQLKKKNENNIKSLEDDRSRAENDLIDTNKKTADLKHEIAKLKILIEKTRNEIDYLTSEKDKARGQGYQRKIDEFNNVITESERRTKKLKDELGTLNNEWKDKVTKTSKLASSSIGRGEGEEVAKRIRLLTTELNNKNKELESLRSQKSTLEREVADDGSGLDDKINKQRDQLDELNRKYLASLEEKNGINEELTEQVRKLLDLNFVIQKNSEQIAIAKQEIEFLRKEIEQKSKLVGDLEYEVEQRRNLIIDLREEIAEKNLIIDELEQPRDEIDTIEMLIKEKDDIIRELEAQIRNRSIRTKSTIKETIRVESSSSGFTPDSGDNVDVMLHDYIQGAEHSIPFKKLGGGHYMFGTKKIYAKIMNGNLVVKVGGGFMSIEEFIEAYGESELEKVKNRRAKGLDIFDGSSRGSPKGRY
ncbi:unnamed protein product [Moneuplotes crassus]|uniref:GAR domain-containing protein n=2 Tax=Euplotes crassus TaxID=5936 RepID=A0AAD1X5S3_EUPCR|nr:unnamed protein product [Moneuplotes crassus]